MRQDGTGGARARERVRGAVARGEQDGGKSGPAARNSERALIKAAKGSSQSKAGAMMGACPSPSGSVTRMAGDAAGERALSTTLVVAGLNAEPVNRLEGGPNGASALNRATLIAIHRAARKSRRLFLSCPCVADRFMRDMIPSGDKDRDCWGQKPPLRAGLAVDMRESFQ